MNANKTSFNAKDERYKTRCDPNPNRSQHLVVKSDKKPEIPKFYERIPTNDDSLASRVREEARAMFLQNMSKNTIENQELQELWVLLEKSCPQTTDNCEKQRIDYKEFKMICQTLKSDSKAKQYFTATTFAKLQDKPPDPNGKISILNFFNYVMRSVWLKQTRIALSLYDITGQGFLKESDLENYIQELIPTLSQLDSLDKAFHPFYVCIAVRKFFFFLDPHKQNKIKILDVLSSGFLDDLLELRDEDLNKTREEANWFSATNTLRLYSSYLRLDEDHNGMLSKPELLKYGNLTNIFIERLFEVCITYDKEIDFKTYIDIVLALENRKEPQAIYFFFQILDIKNQRFVDSFCIKYFFKAIQEQMKTQGQEPLGFDDVCNEIYDMVRPEVCGQITFEDLISCGQADTIINILIDINGFWAYENRELQLIDTKDDKEDKPEKEEKEQKEAEV